MALKRYESWAKGPLDGVRILDLSRLVAGNAFTHLPGASVMPRKDIEAPISQGIVCDDDHGPGAQGEGE